MQVTEAEYSDSIEDASYLDDAALVSIATMEVQGIVNGRVCVCYPILLHSPPDLIQRYQRSWQNAESKKSWQRGW